MNHVTLRTKIFEDLYQKRIAAGTGVGATEIARIAQRVGASAVATAMACKDLVMHGHVESDGNMMGRVRLSDRGVSYYEEVQSVHRQNEDES